MIGFTQFKKIFRDIIQNKSKSMLVIIGIFFGVFGTALILDSFLVIKNEVFVNYMNTNPASFSLSIDNVDDNLIKSLEKNKDIEYVENRPMVNSRVEIGDNEWVTALLYIVDDFSNIKINTFASEEGQATPKTGEILLEREALSVAKTRVGDSLLTKVPLQDAKTLKVCGSVHAAGLKPAWIEKNVYGFISKETLKTLGGNPADYSQILFTVSGDKLNKEQINKVMSETEKWCKDNGYIVSQVDMPTPGKHPNGDQINALLFLFEAFGILSLLLSAILVINLISSMLSGQIKQIGIMKAMGANKFKIARMYYTIVLILGIISLIFAVPAAAYVSKGIVDLCSEVLNFDVLSYKIPLSSYIIQILAGILIPALAATFPILKGCRITVNDALHNSNVNKSGAKFSKLIDETKKLKFIGSIMIMSIRNTFRRRNRLFLTVVTLVAGGVIFIAAINLRVSLNKTIDNAMKGLNYDSLFVLSTEYKTDSILEATKNIDGIASSEIYSGSTASLKLDDETQSNTFQFVALPKNEKALNLPLREGKWLSDSGSNEVVVNHLFLDSNPKYKVGDEITIISNNTQTTWKIVGLVKEVGGSERVYTNSDYYRKVFSSEGSGGEIAFFYNNSNKETADLTTREIEKKLSKAGIDVESKLTKSDVSSVFANHLKLIAGFLIVASILIIVVGVIGLISSTSINILERLRELGVMRAIGASPGKITSMFIYENIIVGLISFVMSCLLAIPLTNILCKVFGNIFLKMPLDMVYSPLALLIWLIAIMLITIIVSFYLSRKAMLQPVYEIINYE